jgi:hypothetical protein
VLFANCKWSKLARYIKTAEFTNRVQNFDFHMQDNFIVFVDIQKLMHEKKHKGKRAGDAITNQ